MLLGFAGSGKTLGDGIADNPRRASTTLPVIDAAEAACGLIVNVNANP